jgi:cytochrome c oxidase assembly protein subunit 15
MATLLTAVFAFPLIWMGGLVTSHAAGMSVPDWPNSYGYNMFALPFSQWLGQYAGGTFYEHTHRLLGTLVGFTAFVATMICWGPSRSAHWRRAWKWSAISFAILFVLSLAISLTLRHSQFITEDAYRHSTHIFSSSASFAVASLVLWLCRSRDPLRWRRWIVTSVLFIIIVQGLMGGFRVTEISLFLAKLHGIFGQMVFAFAAVVAVMCSRWWTIAPRYSWTASGWLKPLAIIALLLISTQLVLGALMRHDPRRDPSTGGGAGLSIPDWPLHYGKVLPPTNGTELAKINEYRRWEINYATTTLGAIWLQFAHRMTAYLTGLVVLGTAWYVLAKHRFAKLAVTASLLAVLVVTQITLGVLTVLWKKPADVATLHQAGGALLLMLASVLLVRAVRLYPSPAKSAGAPAASASEMTPVVPATAGAARR